MDIIRLQGLPGKNESVKCNCPLGTSPAMGPAVSGFVFVSGRSNKLKRQRLYLCLEPGQVSEKLVVCADAKPSQAGTAGLHPVLNVPSGLQWKLNYSHVALPTEGPVFIPYTAL